MNPVRVRFAPSPTGRLHIGGARTALFNWAFARSRGGAFVLRIEDTDVARNTRESLDSIRASLRWLGLDWDEGPEAGGDHGPYFQSERGEHYRRAVARGLEEGWLYRCFVPAEEIERQREEARAAKRNWRFDAASRAQDPAEAARRAEAGEAHVLRFRVGEDDEVALRDHVRGDVRFRAGEVEDWVAVRTNGQPTYNFACVVDDAAMQITHVLRGEEHLVNTPKQVLLFRALGEEPPEYAHLPLILGADGKKMSKRTGDTAVEDYRAKGYPPEALFNFLSLLGFSIDDKTTVFGREDMLEHFDFKRLSKAGALFDVDKLHWLCGDYVRRTPVATLTDRVLPWLREAGLVEGEPVGEQRAWLERVVAAHRERITLYAELPQKVAHLFADAVEPDEKARKALEQDGADEALAAVAGALEDAGAWPPEDFAALVKAVAAERGVGVGKVMKPVRAALTGTLGGPELQDVVELLGRERTLARLRRQPVQS